MVARRLSGSGPREHGDRMIYGGVELRDLLSLYNKTGRRRQMEIPSKTKGREGVKNSVCLSCVRS